MPAISDSTVHTVKSDLPMVSHYDKHTYRLPTLKMSSSSRNPPFCILLTGTTGLIGGTVLKYILTSILPNFKAKHFTLTVLVRDAPRAASFTTARGIRVHTVVYGGLDDIEKIILAGENDFGRFAARLDYQYGPRFPRKRSWPVLRGGKLRPDVLCTCCIFPRRRIWPISR